MINKTTVGVRFAINVVNSVQSALKTFVHADSVALGFVCPIVAYNRSIHFSFLVYVGELVFSKGFPSALTSFFRFADKRNSICLAVFSTDLIISYIGVRNRVFINSVQSLVDSFIYTDGSFFPYFQGIS